MPSRCSKLLLSLAAAGGVALTATSAYAITITTSVPQITRIKADGSTDSATTGIDVYTITKASCASDIRFKIPVVYGDFAGSQYTIQVWAGTNAANCSETANRTGTTARCWPVTAGTTPGGNGSDALIVLSRDVLSQVEAPTKVASYTGGSEALCSSVTASTEVILYVLALNAGDAAASVKLTEAIRVRMGALPTPTLNSARGGDGRVILNYTFPSDAGTNADLRNFVIYCSPKPGVTPTGAKGIGLAKDPSTCEVVNEKIFSLPPPSASASTTTQALTPAEDAGGDATADAASDASVSTDATAASDATTPPPTDPGTTPVPAPSTATDAGTTPVATIDGAYRCGETSGTTASDAFEIDGFTNGYPVHVAMAAQDRYGNIGPPSAIRCAIPVPIDDFWKAYKEAGGRAGGGYCALEGVGMPAGTCALALVMTASAVGLVRRRRRS